MKTFLVAAALFIVGLSAADAAENETQTIPLHEAAQQLPAIKFLDGENQQRSLADWRGRIVLLNVWATWCGPCRVEMPTLDRLQKRLGDDKFEVVALSIDRAGAGVVRRFYDQIEIEALGLYIDQSGGAVRALKIVGLPATLLIGPDGREFGRLVGPAEWDAPAMVSFLQSFIAKQSEKD